MKVVEAATTLLLATTGLLLQVRDVAGGALSPKIGQPDASQIVVELNPKDIIAVRESDDADPRLFFPLNSLVASKLAAINRPQSPSFPYPHSNQWYPGDHHPYDYYSRPVHFPNAHFSNPNLHPHFHHLNSSSQFHQPRTQQSNHNIHHVHQSQLHTVPRDTANEEQLPSKGPPVMSTTTPTLPTGKVAKTTGSAQSTTTPPATATTTEK